MKLREVFIPLLEPEKLLPVASMDFPDLPPPGSDAWCDYLAEWKGNISRFPTLVTDELVQQCLLNDVSREYIETTTTHQWLALVLLVIPLAGVIGNSLVCIAVWQERRLHNVTNFFLVSLALADLMVCLAVMPFGVLELFYGYWPFSTFVCTVWVTCDVLGCSASILHLCCISVGRYIGIRNPLRTRQRTQYTSRRSVLTRVTGVWLLASVISCPVPLLAIKDIDNVRPNNSSCAINNQVFLVFGSICAFYLPMIVMVIIYFLTVHELHKPPDLATGNQQQQQQHQQQQQLEAQDQQQQQQQQQQRSPTPSGTHAAAATNSGGCSSNGNTALGVSFSRITSTKANGSASSTETCPCILAVRAARALNERRATKVLGVVFLLFFVCWSPFFVLNVVQVPLGSDFFPSYVGTGFLWLGYLSSTVNPLVYTVFNRVFRSTFWQLLTCRCGKRRRRLLYTNTIRGQSYGTSKDVVSWSFRSTYRQRADVGLAGGGVGGGNGPTTMPGSPGHPERP